MNRKDKAQLLREGVGYYLAPAAIDSPMPSLIKEVIDGSTKPSSTTYKEGTLAKYHITLPGKSLYVANDSYALRKPNLLKSKNFHDWRKDIASPFCLINHVDSPERITDLLKASKIVLQDSGGFQMAVGRTDFVSPEHVVNKHKQNCDIGVMLDVPLYPFTHAITADNLSRVASVTERTNRYFARSGWKTFLNLNHGRNIKERLRWMELTQKNEPGIALCIGGFISSNRKRVLPKAFAARPECLYMPWNVKQAADLVQVACCAPQTSLGMTATDMQYATRDTFLRLLLLLKSHVQKQRFDIGSCVQEFSRSMYNTLDWNKSK